MNKLHFGIKNFNKNNENPFKINDLGKDTRVIQISNNDFFKLLGLSRTSLKLLHYLISQQSNYLETVCFDLKQCKLFTGFKGKRSVYNGLMELLGEGIIARTEKENIYYFNKNIISILSSNN